ncbi:MAG: hypothetical protein ABI867_34525 [Kofleriaceae bacterium]
MGAHTRQQLGDALAGLEVTLDAAGITELERAVPASEIAGTRYPAPMMAHLESEKVEAKTESS